MQLKSSYLLLVFTLGLFSSCPLKNTFTGSPMGVTVSNYPTWIGDTENPWTAASEWYDWDSSIHKIKTIIPENFNKADYSGKFRIIDTGQHVSIEFDDGTSGCFVYIWIKEETPENYKSYSIKQTSDSQFIINGYAKYSFDDKAIIEAQQNYTFISEDEKSYKYNYTLTINNVVIFSIDIISYKISFYEKNAYPDWLPLNFYSSEADINDPIAEPIIRAKSNLNNITTDTIESIISFVDMQHDTPYRLGVVKSNILFFHQGIKLVDQIDSINKIVKYSLHGNSPTSSVEFVELKLLNEKTVLFNWIDSNNKIIKEQTTWIKE